MAPDRERESRIIEDQIGQALDLSVHPLEERER